ncbi:acylneuraminate cytidylyltransferase [Clostridiaceae bacterium 14S0207]|nr:acylneuraminate cytidylyltransferase [Clostridiaceae bacterium 14S0207]
MKVVCIIQARYGSTRLPGKVLKQICGKSILQHDIERIKLVKSINEIIVATSNLTRDDIIEAEVKKCGISVSRGSEEDVLSRYYYAAKQNKADIVVRITSDCPLIDMDITNDIIKLYLNNFKTCDYVSNTLERTFPRGLDVEVFSFDVLEKAFNESVLLRDREHVTPYIWDNPEKFRIKQFKGDINYSDLRWTVDTKEDFDLVKTIYEKLYPSKNNLFGMKEILDLYKYYPELREINGTILQKKI